MATFVFFDFHILKILDSWVNLESWVPISQMHSAVSKTSPGLIKQQRVLRKKNQFRIVSVLCGTCCFGAVFSWFSPLISMQIWKASDAR